MAVATYASDLTTFWLTGSTTVTALGGGGAALGNPETDFYIQGSDCLSKGAWTNATKGFIVDALGATFTQNAPGAIVVFAKYDAAASLDTQANGGLQIIIGTSDSDYEHYYVGGNDTIEFNSWVPYVIDYATATPDATTGSPSGDPRWVGVLAKLPSTAGPTKGNPIGIDAMRYGSVMTLTVELGEIANPANFVDMEAWSNDPTRRQGHIELIDGVFQVQGQFQLDAAEFEGSDDVLMWRKQKNCLTDDAVDPDFNRIILSNASSKFNLTNVFWGSLSSVSPGTLDMTSTTIRFTNCTFVDWGVWTFSSFAVPYIIGCSFVRCGSIISNTVFPELTNTSFLTPNISANESALVWNTNTDPNLWTNGMTFSKTSGTAHHAMEFGTTVADGADWTMTNCHFGTDFSNTADGSVGDETFHFKDTTGSITLTLIECTGNFGYRTEGVAVTLIADPATVTVTCVDGAGDPVENARVIIYAGDGTGALPFEQEVSTLTRSGETATCTTVGDHGLIAADYAAIYNVTEREYGIQADVAITSATVFTYPVTTRENLMLQSQDLSLSHSNFQTTDAQSVGTAPDGTNTANSISEDGNFGQHYVSGSITPASTTQYTASVHVKASNRDWVWFVVGNLVPLGVNAYFNLTGAGSVGSTPGADNDSESITYLGDGWYRISLTFTNATDNVGALRTYIAAADNNVSFTGASWESVWWWGEQFELGAEATEYIPTTTAAIKVPSTPATNIDDPVVFLIEGQTDGDYNNNPVTEGTFTAGTGYSLDDLITLSNGAIVRSDNITSFITWFYVLNATQTSDAVDGVTLTQVSVSPTGGTGFTLTPGVDNLKADDPISVTGVYLSGLTDSNGQISDVRTITGADQPITGVVRQGTASPLFKQLAFAGTVTRLGDTNFNVILIADE